MTLEKYTQGRLVVMHPDTTAYDAVRAMEDNHIGAIVVRDDSGVVGFVTDRDLALQVIAFDEDPFEIRLCTLMSRPVEVISTAASAAEAAQRMLDRRVRRLPIVDGSKLVGMVTLDDLIADCAIDPGMAADIVRSQLAEPARLKDAGQRRPVVATRDGVSWRDRRWPRRRVERRGGQQSGFAWQLRKEVASAFRRITGG
jgi:CBS domain-containing protein